MEKTLSRLSSKAAMACFFEDIFFDWMFNRLEITERLFLTR